MKFRIRFADQIVGIFVLIAIAALVGILILMGINQRWFAQNYYFESRFESGSGIDVGMAITLKGFEIGKVDTIELNEENNVDILFYIYDTYYEKVKPNSVLELASSTFGLGGGLRLHPGKNDREPIPENSFIPSMDFEEGQRLVQNGLVAMPKSDDAISSIVSKVGPMLDQVDATLVSVQTLLDSANSAIAGENEGPLGDILVDVSMLTKNVDTMIRDINTMVRNINGRLTAVFDNVDEITDNVEATTEAMRDPTGIVKTVLDPKGSFAKLLDDDNVLFEQIEEVLTRVNETIDQVHEFTTFINTTTPQISGLLEKSREALDQGKDVLEGLRNNPLLRGGISEQKEQASTFQSYRDEDF